LLDHLFGAKIVWTPNKDRDNALKYTFDVAWENGERPYMIPYGGSNEIGAAAYTYALNELLEQWTELSQFKPYPNWIVFPTSSGGTHAGLVLGAEIHGYTGKILGICIDDKQTVMSEKILGLANKTADVLGVSTRIAPEIILANDGYLGGGYGVISDAEREAIYLFARNEGILLDPVYTGRAAAGLVDLIRKGFFKKEDMVVFWHTGGTPVLFADQYREFIISA